MREQRPRCTYRITPRYRRHDKTKPFSVMRYFLAFLATDYEREEIESVVGTDTAQFSLPVQQWYV